MYVCNQTFLQFFVSLHMRIEKQTHHSINHHIYVVTKLVSIYDTSETLLKIVWILHHILSLLFFIFNESKNALINLFIYVMYLLMVFSIEISSFIVTY